MDHLSGFFLVITSFRLEQTPEPALLADDRAPHVAGMPPRRVPDPVGAVSEPLHPQRRSVEREILHY